MEAERRSKKKNTKNEKKRGKRGKRWNGEKAFNLSPFPSPYEKIKEAPAEERVFCVHYRTSVLVF